jgi:signal transduction histidine kinase
MKPVPRRIAATAIALAVLAVGASAAAADWPSARPAALLSMLWLLLVGCGFLALLARHLRVRDQLAWSQSQLGLERHARALAERAQADSHTALCRLIQQQEQVRENERNRIARDIHDDLGQHLLAVKIELSLLQVSTSGAHPQLHQKIGSLHAAIGLTIGALRRIINDLRPLALENGLRTAIETHLSDFSRVNGIRHELEADPDAFRAKPDQGVDAMLFRILQESLSNVVRHAQATEVKIALLRSGDLLTLNVRDNGIGMASHSASCGCGLVGIADRVTAAGGKFVIDSKPGAGTLLSLSIPLARPLGAD